LSGGNKLGGVSLVCESVGCFVGCI
jgi:hypothetical protein